MLPIDRPNATAVDDVRRFFSADPDGAVAQREHGVHYRADKAFGCRKGDDRRVVKDVDTAAGDDPEIAFAILVHRIDLVPRETVRTLVAVGVPVVHAIETLR